GSRQASACRPAVRAFAHRRYLWDGRLQLPVTFQSTVSGALRRNADACPALVTYGDGGECDRMRALMLNLDLLGREHSVRESSAHLDHVVRRLAEEVRRAIGG